MKPTPEIKHGIKQGRNCAKLQVGPSVAHPILQHCSFFDIFICNFCISDADADFEADSMINEVQNNKCLGIDLQIVLL
jgi:hypothetical protein